MSEILKDNGRRLIAALETIHGRQVSGMQLMMMADELIAHRFDQPDPDVFDERMNRYLMRLDTAAHGHCDSDSRHTLVTLAIINMISWIKASGRAERSIL